MGFSKKIEDRFWKKVQKSDGCWNWIGYKTQIGYGIIVAGKLGIDDSIHTKRLVAHRVSYGIHYGVPDKKLFVCHKCDNPSCVRPDHLFLGTQTDNMRDCANKDRVRNQGFKPFRIISPNGELIEGINLTKFCRERNLRRPSMFDVISGKRKEHKGYTNPIE